MQKKELFKVPLFVASDAVDEDFASYLVEQVDVHKLVRERKYTVKDTDVSYRVISHWDEKGILPGNFGESADGWRKFSFIEIIWLQMVKGLRDFGLSLDAIARVKENIMRWNEREKTYPWFEYYVMKSKLSSMDGYLVVQPDGTSDLAFSRQIESVKSIFGSRSFILISLKEILNSIDLSTSKPEVLLSLSKDERDVLDVIRNSEVDKITLKLKKGEMVSIDTSKTITGSDMKSIKDELTASGDFAEVIAKFEEGREQSAEVVKKRRF